MKKLIYLATLIAGCFLYSCSKSDLAQPTSTAINANTAKEAASVAAVQTSPTPGNYAVSLYINDTDTSTAKFTGYVFTFSANGKLTAKVGKITYSGKWEVKAKGTQLKLDIDGTPALHEINKDWNEGKLTNTIINLNHDEHGMPNRDILNFTMM